MAPTTALVLGRAANLIDTHGLARGRRRGPGAAQSVDGALQTAVVILGADLSHPSYADATRQVLRRTGPLTVEQWSDATPAATVVSTLRALASDLSGKAPR